MKSAFVLLLLSVFVVAIHSLPPGQQGDDSWSGFNPNVNEMIMCRMMCKQTCMEQGFTRGGCRMGTCYCYGLMTPPGGVPMPMN